MQAKAELQLKEDSEVPRTQLQSERQITTRLPKRTPPPMKTKSSTEADSRSEATVYECTYEGCRRIYGSSVSMNLHIKQKHNGGTKKEREAYAVLPIPFRNCCSMRRNVGNRCPPSPSLCRPIS